MSEPLASRHASGGLVADCGGVIEEIAMAVVPACFSGSPLHQTLLAAQGFFAGTLPQGIRLHVLASPECRQAVTGWLASLPLACETRIVDAPLSQAWDSSEFWIQDPLLVRRDGATTVFLKVDCENPGDHAAWIGRGLGSAVEPCACHIAGGNLLVGPDFRIAGQDSLDFTQALIDREGIGASQPADDAFARLSDMDPRPLFVAGYSFGAEAPSPPVAGRWDDPYRQRQYGGHIDRFIAVTGLVSPDRKPVIVVAEAMLGPGGRSEEFGLVAMALDGTAERLSGQGFHVVRNPVPFAPVLGPLQLRPRLYNNVLVENEVRIGRTRPLVWVPQFADAEPGLAEFDDANMAVWRGLGFEPVGAFGWSGLAAQMGALRCAAKVLRRAATTPARARAAISDESG